MTNEISGEIVIQGFWGEEVLSTQEFKQREFDSKLISVPASTYNELHRRYETISKLIMLSDETQAGLIEEQFKIKNLLDNALMYHPEYQAELDDMKAKGLQVSAAHIDYYTKLEMNFNFPYMKKSQTNKRSYYEAIRGVYSQFITNEINKQLGHIKKPRYEQAFVLIVHYFKGNIIRDLDNHYSSFVFNVLRYKQLIKDDSWMNMEFMEKGLAAEKGPKTEVYICDRYKATKLQIDLSFNKR